VSWSFTADQTWEDAPEDVLVGLAVLSHTTDCCIPARITFDNVSLELGPGGAVLPLDAQPTGVEVAWELTRGELAAGVSYEIDIDSGMVDILGSVEDASILGETVVSLAPTPFDLGSLGDLDFAHAHRLGGGCTGMSVESCGAGCTRISGAGGDIWQTGDRFAFAYTEVAGDFSASVVITERAFPPGSRWGRLGILARQDCSPYSRYSFLHDNGENPIDATRFSARPTHGGSDDLELHGPIPPFSGAHFDRLRLDRCGSEFIGYVLDEKGLYGEPGSWVEVGRLDWGDSAPDSVQVGLAVTSGQGCEIATITFEDWELLPSCESTSPEPAPLFKRGDSNGDGEVNISDAVHTFAWLFLGGAAPPCLDAADSNDTGDINLTDGVFTLNFLFRGGRAPPPPGPFSCGPDGGENRLGCSLGCR
jgi:hypothetical protein